MKDSGIYAIKNTVNGKVYIGQSRRISNREYCHFHALEKGNHYNKHLQRSYNTYGRDTFVFEVIEWCDVSELDEREKYYIKKYDSMNINKGYNNEGGGGIGKEVSERVREAKRGANNPMYGKKISDESKEKMRIASRGHNTNLTEEQVYQLKEDLLNGMPQKEVGMKYGITVGAVAKIQRCKNWGYVHSDINQELIFLHEDERIYKHRMIRALNATGISRQEIARRVGVDVGTVMRVLGNRSEYFRDSDKNKELQSKVVAEYLDGVDRNEIKKKYGISDAKYVSLISDAYNKKRAEHMQKAIELRKQGMMVKDIAKGLGYARTTITKWTLHVK